MSKGASHNRYIYCKINHPNKKSKKHWPSTWCLLFLTLAVYFIWRRPCEGLFSVPIFSNKWQDVWQGPKCTFYNILRTAFLEIPTLHWILTKNIQNIGWREDKNYKYNDSPVWKYDIVPVFQPNTALALVSIGPHVFHILQDIAASTKYSSSMYHLYLKETWYMK